MALELKLKRGAVADDLSYFLVTDNTGTYDVVTNPGGYGAPNIARNQLALFVYGYKYMPNPTADTLLTIINNNDPENATQWQVTMNMDGYHYLRVLAFNIWSDAANYLEGAYVFYQTRYYRALTDNINQDPINNPDDWVEEIDLTTTAIYEHSSVLTYQLDTNIDYRARACYQIQVKKNAKDNCNCNGAAPGPVVKPYMQIFVHLNAARFDCLQGKYPQADAEMQYLAEYCESIGCGC